MNDLQKRTWAEISLGNIRHNYEAIRAALPRGCRFLGVVKADAYGHGSLERFPDFCRKPGPTIWQCPAWTRLWS
ncbi:MAG: alanine racemase [Oscillospiraceae bacterium]